MSAHHICRWDYFAYIVYIKGKARDQYTGPALYVMKCVEEESTESGSLLPEEK